MKPYHRERMNPTEQLVFDAYNDPREGFVSASKLYKKLKLQHPNIKWTDVNNTLKQISRRQQFEPIGKRTYDKIWAPRNRDSYGIDLADMQQVKSENNGVGYIFLCIDFHSRYALMLPCKDKTIASVKSCLQSVFNNTMGKPLSIVSDFESSILSHEVQDWLNQEGVKLVPVKQERKRNNALVERLIRTMRELLAKAWAAYGTRRWIGPLLVAVNENYNNSIHRALKTTPQAIWSGAEISTEMPVRHVYGFRIGDRVRVAKVVGFKDVITAKASQSKTYTKQIYTITGRVGRRYICTNPKNGATTERMGYELQLMDGEPFEFKPDKDSIYAKRPMTGKQAKAMRTKQQNEAALKRDDILQSAVRSTVKRLATMQSTRASDSLEKQSKQNAPAPKRLSKAPMTDSFGIDRFVDKRKDAQGRVEFEVLWDDGSTSWEPRIFLNNPKQSKLPTRIFNQLEREYSQQYIE
jgi:hypothetical protein